MARPIIRLTSVTYAIRAQKLLEQQGIKSYIKKMAKDMSVKGCGYGLEINGDLQKAVEIVKNAGIRITDIVGGE